jgi:hypothetical protein
VFETKPARPVKKEIRFGLPISSREGAFEKYKTPVGQVYILGYPPSVPVKAIYDIYNETRLP